MDGQPERSRYISGTAVMDSATPSSLFADLTRHPTGIIPSCTSADSALHNRYIQASLPLGSASTCPYLGGMYAGSLPAPPNSPFRSPTGNIRQFWPPTPPPEGYNRYGVNPAIYPLFPSVASIAPSSENGALLTPGIGSRLGTLPTHFPHLLDSYSDPSYYSSGYGLGSSLPPSSHVTSNLSLSNLTPTLERHPSYVPLVGRVKGLSIPRQQPEDEEVPRGKGNNFMKWDIPYTSENTKSTKTESQPKSKDSIGKDDVRSASSKGKGESRASAKKNETKHQVKQVMPSVGDGNKSTSVINGSLSSVPSENYDVKLANSRSMPECPKCVVTPSSVRPVNSIEAESRTDSDAVISLVHMPPVTTVTKTAVSSLPNCTVANSHANQPDEENMNNVTQHPAVAQQQSPTAITYVSRQLCYQSISESTVSKSLTGTSSCLSVKISGHVTSVSSSQVVLDGNKHLSEKANLNVETGTVSPIWNEQKPVENVSTKDYQKTEELLSEKTDKMPSITLPSNLLPLPTENTSPVRENSFLQVKEHSQHALKVPSTISNVIPTHHTSNKPSSVCCKNIRNIKLSEQIKISDTKETAYVSLPIQPKREQSSSCKIEQVKPSISNNWNRTKTQENICDAECEPQAINLSLSQKLPKSEPNELPNCKATNAAKAPQSETSYLPAKSLAPSELSSNTRTKSQLPDSCLKSKKISAMRWPQAQTQNLSNRFGSGTSCQPRANTNSLSSLSVRNVKNCLNQQPVVPSSTPVTNVSSLVKPTISTTTKSSLKSAAAIKLPARGATDSNCHRNSVSVAPSLSSSIENTRKPNSDDGQSASNLLPTLSLPTFSGTVNSSIPIGIAIAQQRQETTSPKPDEKREINEQSNHVTSAPVASTTNLVEVVRDQKPTDRIPRHSAPADTGGVLVTLGPTTLNTNQWDSDSTTRTSMSQSWVTHTPVVAPTVWVGQSVQSTPAASTTLPVMPVSTLDTSQVPISTGGFQLARDPITGHLYLIPATKLTDHTGVWPVFVPTNGSVPLQQVVPHTQNSQVIEADQVTDSTVTLQQSQTQIQSIRLHTTAPAEKTFCDINTTVNQENQDNTQFIYPSVKQETKEEKSTDISLLNSLPVATGQPFAYAAFSLHGGTVSYYFEPTSVVHLAQTQVTASIQTESGKRSQGTSPLHSVTPSPPPANPTEQGTQASGTDENIDEGDESDDSSSANQASTQTRISSNTLAVATATQVDMNSDDDYEERNVEMSDSACQTEAIIGNMLREDDVDDDISQHSHLDTETTLEIPDDIEMVQQPTEKSVSLPLLVEKDDHKSEAVVKKELCTIDVEIASDSTPVLTAESKPVMDFIDHHGLDLLVDSIEEFACREQEMQQEGCKVSGAKEDTSTAKELPSTEELEINNNNKDEKSSASAQNQNSSAYPSIDPFCVDGLGLLCALAEQRFLEEKMNSHDEKEDGCPSKTKHACSSPFKKDTKKVEISSNSLTENKPKGEIFAVSSFGKSLLSKDHKHETSLIFSPAESMDPAELEMRIRMAELQHKYKQKQQELSRLRPKTKKEIDSVQLKKPIAKLKGQQIFTCCKSKCASKPNVVPLNKLEHKSEVSTAKPELETNGQQNSSPINKCLKIEKADDNLHSNFSKAVSPLNGKNVTTFSKTSKENIQLLSRSSDGKVLSRNLVKGDSVSVQEDMDNGGAVTTKSSIEGSRIQSIKVEKTDDDIAICKENLNVSSSANSGLLIPKPPSECTAKRLDTGTTGTNDKQRNVKDETEKKVPFFDESVWSIRRSERIFLHEAGVVKPSYDNSVASNKKKRTTSLTQGKISEKLSLSCPSTTSKSDSAIKQKVGQKLSESSVLKTKKKIPMKKVSDLKAKKVNKIQNKKSSVELLHCAIPSSLKKDESEESSSDSESSTSDESDSSSSDTASSDDSDDTPLSALIKRPMITPADAIAKAQSCIMTVESLQDKQRVLMMDDGLFYGGQVIAIHAPDVYGIHLDGDRGSRHRIYSREEMLKATVLEVKPTSHLHLIEGSRVCAFWSQQYRCLYPGTVTKTNSPPDDGLIYVEFDDGDSGRIPLEDICLLPPNYPIVTVKPTPHLALKRRHCISSKQNIDAKKKILYPVKDNSQPSKSHKLLSSKKVKTSHPDKVCCSPFHTTKVVTSSAQPSIGSSSVLSAPQAMNLSMANSKKDNKKEVKQNTKVTSVNGSKEKTEITKTSSEGQLISKLKKHKRHHDESKHHHHHRHHHHRRHHRRHHHHHHKRHKRDRQTSPSSSEQCKPSPTHVSSTLGSPSRSSSESSLSSDSSSVSSVNASFNLPNKSNNTSQHSQKKSELTVKIKTSPADTHLQADDNCNASSRSSSDSSDSSDSSSDEENSLTAQEEMRHKVSTSQSDTNEKKGRDRRPSVEKSKIAAFLPARQIWRWSGNCFRRRAMKGRAKKDYYRAVTRGKETIKVGDCAVFLSTGRPHLPYIGRIETMWQSWGGNMVVKVKWFYHPEETRGGKRLAGLKGALFQSSHLDENDVQTISHKCEVLSWEEYKKRRDQEIFQNPAFGSIFDNNDIYYLAGTYEPTTGIITMEPGIT